MIHAGGLARSFRTRRGTVEAVCGVDIHVAPGELVGFLGPNGAGKTTTLRMLTTLLAPTAGTATVAGCDLLRDPVGVRRRIGYVGQAGGAGPDCPVLDELVLQGACTACRRSAPTSVAVSCSASSSSPAPRRAQTDPRGRHR